MWRWTQAGGLFTYIISAFTNGIYNWQKPSLGLPSLSDEDMIVASECSAPVVSQNPPQIKKNNLTAAQIVIVAAMQSLAEDGENYRCWGTTKSRRPTIPLSYVLDRFVL